MLNSFEVNRSNRAERGGALVELSLVIPVLIFLMAAVLSAGRIIEQFAWLNQTAYQSYLLGSEEWDNVPVGGNPYGKRSNIMRARFALLQQGNRDIALPATFLGLDPGGADVTDTDLAGKMFSIQASGDLHTILGPLSVLRVGASVTGPVLALDPGDVSNLASFSNPDTTKNCSQLPDGGSLDTPCWDCSAGPSYSDCFCPDGTICNP
jgi:hypothetical protein